RRNTTRNSRWSSKRSSHSLLRPSRQSAELAFTNPKSRRSLLTDHDIPPVSPPNFRNPHSVIRIPQSFFRSSFSLLHSSFLDSSFFFLPFCRFFLHPSDFRSPLPS